MLKFKEYLKLINENTSNTKIKDFSFSTWLLEAAMSPATRYAARAKVKALGDSKVLEKAELIMELVKQKLFTHWPMWRPFWSKTPPIASFGAGSKDEDGFGTMCTTGTAIFYCPRFVLEQYEIAKTTFASQFPGGNIPNANSAIRTGLRHPMDYSLFVIIHELSHIASITEGHNSEFIANFRWLLREAKALGYYEPVDYRTSPMTYCGVNVTNNPYF